MTKEHTSAPETKAFNSDVTNAFDEFMNAFEGFKEANDERLSQIEKRMSADVITHEKVDRISKAMDQLSLKAHRPQLSREGSYNSQPSEHKTAFNDYVRRGDERAMKKLEEKSFSVGVPSDGGILVPFEIEQEIGKRLSALSPIRSISSVRQISAGTLKKPFATTGFQTGWSGETAARPITNTPTLSEMQFPAMELYAMPAATTALLDDSAIDIDSWLASEVETVFAEQESAAFVNGDGNNKPKGFLNYNQVPNAAHTWGNIGYLASGLAAQLPAGMAGGDLLMDLPYSLNAGYRQGGSWVMNRKTQAAIRKLKDAQGNYLWNPPLSVERNATLMGFNLVESEDMPDIAANATPIAFGNFNRGYLVVDRMGVRILRDPYSSKPYVLFYTTKRVGGGVQDFNAIKLLKCSTT